MIRRIRLVLLVILLILIPSGLATKWFHGTGAWWVNNYLGGVLYELFWCLVALFFWPRASAIKISFWVFVCTDLLEILQLWNPEFLAVVRSTFVGKTLIGTTFAWLDFPHYLVGCIIGWYMMKKIKGSVSARNDASCKNP
jgi:hypothetical protein